MLHRNLAKNLLKITDWEIHPFHGLLNEKIIDKSLFANINLINGKIDGGLAAVGCHVKNGKENDP